MKTLIIVCGKTGVTYKAGNMLAKLIGDATVTDGKVKDVDGFDVYVLGTNVRFGKFNKRFLKLLPKMQEAKLFVYICGAEIEREEYYIDCMRKLAPFAADIAYVWGELDPSKAKFFDKYAIESFIDGRRKDGLPRPRLLEKEIKALANKIRECM